jgi:hypothetical protein
LLTISLFLKYYFAVMTKLTHFVLFTFLLGNLLSCSTAQKATEVQSVRIPVAPYLKLSCKELATEQNALVREAEAAGAQVDSTHDSDQAAVLVTWLLFWPAAFLIEGNQEEASRLASIKGQLEAVSEAQKINDCTDN